MARNHYDVLQVRPTASAEEIQRAYRALALRYHPDRNPSPDASSRMAAINEAYETLSESARRRHYDSSTLKAAPNDELALSVLSAAHDAILRGGWTVLEDLGKTLLIENGKQRLRVVFSDRLDNDALVRMARQYPELTAALALTVEVPIRAGFRIIVIDLMHARQHGARIPEGPCKSLLSGFL